MRRRDFIVAMGGAAALPTLARAQQAQRVRRVGLLYDLTNVPKGLRDALEKLGWVEGRNLKLDLRYGEGDSDRLRAYAAELVSLKPDVIVVSGPAQTKAVQQQTQTIPIVFGSVGDPVAAGIVKSVARPEGNATGITNGFSSLGGKRVQLLKEAVPTIERVAHVHNPQDQPEDSYFAAIDEAARALDLQLITIPYRNAVDFERAIEAFAAEPNGGAIVNANVAYIYSQPLFFELMIKHRLPAIYYREGNLVAEGGLMAYGLNAEEAFRRLASHVDRILRGAKPGDLPIEYPTRFDLTVNLKAAEAIGIMFSETFLLRADKIIE